MVEIAPTVRQQDAVMVSPTGNCLPEYTSDFDYFTSGRNGVLADHKYLSSRPGISETISANASNPDTSNNLPFKGNNFAVKCLATAEGVAHVQWFKVTPTPITDAVFAKSWRPIPQSRSTLRRFGAAATSLPWMRPVLIRM